METTTGTAKPVDGGSSPEGGSQPSTATAAGPIRKGPQCRPVADRLWDKVKAIINGDTWRQE